MTLKICGKWKSVPVLIPLLFKTVSALWWRQLIVNQWCRIAILCVPNTDFSHFLNTKCHHISFKMCKKNLHWTICSLFSISSDTWGEWMLKLKWRHLKIRTSRTLFNFLVPSVREDCKICFVKEELSTREMAA